MSEAGSLLRTLSGRTTARNFHSYVISEIGIGIVSGRFPVGSVLPNDAFMMAQYGVSRTVLREALKTLEAKGLVEAKPKVGTRVSPKSRWNLFDPQVLAWQLDAEPDTAFLTSLADIRFALETRAAELAAVKRSADHVRTLHYWVNQMETSIGSIQNYALADFELHRTIAEASQNPFMRSISGIVEFALTAAFLKISSDENRSMLEESVKLHRRMVIAIEARDPEAARAAMHQTIADGLNWATVPKV
jgi:DNA-binding FadR family transcriptional regulator